MYKKIPPKHQFLAALWSATTDFSSIDGNTAVGLQSPYSPPHTTLCLFHLWLFLYVCVRVSVCRLSVQTVSHEPLLGPEAVLESSEAWRKHRRSAPQQAPCKQSDRAHASLHSLHTDRSSDSLKVKRRKDGVT